MRRFLLGGAVLAIALLVLIGATTASAAQLGSGQAVEGSAVEVESEAAGEAATEAAEEGVRRGEELAESESEAEAAKVERAEAIEGAAAKAKEAKEAERAKKVAEAEAAKQSKEAEEAKQAKEAERARRDEEAEAAAESDEGALSSLDFGDGASTLEALEIPTALLPVYQACGTRYGISWEVLAAIDKVETGFGDDPDEPIDAICSVARDLAASGGETDIYDAVLAYDHSDSYAREVLADARRYERVPGNLVNALSALAAGSTFPVAGETEIEGSESKTATIAAEDGAKALAVADGTVVEAGQDEARGNYVVLRDAYGDRFVYSDLGEVAVGAGESVEEGAELGLAGESAVGFAVHPDASPAVDPTELLELWKRGGTGAVYAVDSEAASAASRPVRSLLMSATALRREVLADPDLELPDCVRRAVNSGELRRQGLATLEYLTASGYEVGVAGSTCEGGAGFALDIASVDGKSVEGAQGEGTVAAELVSDVVAMDGSTAPQTVASATGIAAAETGGTSAATIELDYEPPRQARIVDGDAVAPTDAPAAVQAMIAAANQIDDTPYIWGGGHGDWVAAGYDCSGAVSYVLHAAKMLASPETSGALESWGESGVGNWVTVYANAGHTYAVIAGLRWDTVGDATGSGPRWHTSGAYPAGFTVRHPAGL
jgi:murein DD-endopeptidase MepM/ murein hydrolase activator NlpD